MIKNSLVKKTVYLSLLMQLITTMVSLDGLNYELPEKDTILYDILILEALVQFVEAGFYIWVALSLKDINFLTPTRYIDWFITTPTMLISTIIFMEYLKQKQMGVHFTIREFLVEKKQDVIYIATTNFLMLLFGYLGEIGYIDNMRAIFIGSIFFLMSFKYIYDHYARYTQYGRWLFNTMFSLWALYAVAAYLPVVSKNTMYNILDIFSKNFYGIFIYIYITQVGTRSRVE
jgi:hypothetical protein